MPHSTMVHSRTANMNEAQVGDAQADTVSRQCLNNSRTARLLNTLHVCDTIPTRPSSYHLLQIDVATPAAWSFDANTPPQKQRVATRLQPPWEHLPVTPVRPLSGTAG